LAQIIGRGEDSKSSFLRYGKRGFSLASKMENGLPRNAMKYSFTQVPRCNMCGSPERKMLGMRLNKSQGLRPKSVSGIAVSVKQCTNCDLVYSDPQPVPFSMDDHYGVPPAEYWGAHALSFSPTYYAEEIATAKRLLGFKPGMTALDIGAGIGRGMAALQMAGFDVRGLEPSKPFRDYAVSAMNIDPDRISERTIEQAEFPANSFDFINFGAVLEHFYTPAGAIARAAHWLAPGGLLYAEVPSSKYLMPRLINAFYKLRGVNYVSNLSPMHPPFHLYEFGLRSFKQHGEQTGYEVVQAHYSVCTIRHAPRILHPFLRWWMEKTSSGMQLHVWMRKRSSHGKTPGSAG
jgi:SAM-dependent methyltransferase